VLNKVADFALGRWVLALRYLGVSAVNVTNHQMVLLIANSGWGWSGGRANVLAAVVSAIPAYFMSRHWVWQVEGKHSLRAEIVPFWGLALLGLVVSSVLAEVADRLSDAWYVVAVASLTGYVIVWVIKFILLDRLFKGAANRLSADHATPTSP
jgi:putative flippase GtrA